VKTLPLSLIIPCYNEEARLEPGLSQSLSFLRENLKEPFELILVNDGSQDRTAEIFREFIEKRMSWPVKVIGYEKNRGKGFAVRTGALAAAGEKLIVMDADFSIDIGETSKFVQALEECDVAIGTKKHLLTQSIRHQKMPRRILGRGFTALTNWMLGLHFTDITCGLKGFRRKAAADIFRRQRIERWAYDAETLFLAKRMKYRVAEIPVRWSHREKSKVSALADTLRSFKDLWRILFNYSAGKYKIG
jgi:dolichyl-phosphate beta-glucosyltransferase